MSDTARSRGSLTPAGECGAWWRLKPVRTAVLGNIRAGIDTQSSPVNSGPFNSRARARVSRFYAREEDGRRSGAEKFLAARVEEFYELVILSPGRHPGREAPWDSHGKSSHPAVCRVIPRRGGLSPARDIARDDKRHVLRLSCNARFRSLTTSP